jgi:hypothetical protein
MIALNNLMMHIVDHCNLKCNLCGHYSNIASPSFLDIGWFDAQVKRSAELYYPVKRFSVMGGEPLLHPRLVAFLIIAKEYFPASNVELWTNGILLKRNNEELWETMSDLKIKLWVASYPDVLSKETQDTIRNTANKYGVECKLSNVRYFWDFFNAKGDSNPTKAVRNCSSMSCTQLYNGKLYLCHRPTYIHILNNESGTEIKVDERDYVNIFDEDAESQSKKLFKKRGAFGEFDGKLGYIGQTIAKLGVLGKENMRQPLEFCRWCTERKVPIEWGRGEYK